MLPVKGTEPADWHSSEEDVVYLVHVNVIELRTRKSCVIAVEKDRKHIDDVLIEHVEDQITISSVGLSTMGKHQVLQELKLANRVVGRTSSLLAFETADAYSDMGCCDHVYIVSSIADCKSCEISFALLLLADDVDYFCLLFW